MKTRKINPNNVFTGIMIGLLLTMTLHSVAFAQDVYKFDADAYALRQKVNNVWPDWPEWEPVSNILVTAKFNDDGYGTLKIYSSTTQKYDLVSVIEAKEDDDGDSVIKYLAEDAEGVTCNVKWVLSSTDKYTSQVYVIYSDWQWVYSITKR